MKISIVILNYNGLSETLECLESIKACEVGNNSIEIIVVDNNSSDGSGGALSKLKDINLIENRQNLGFSGGNNVGIKKAIARGSDAVLILNNDTIVDKSLFTNLISALKVADIVSPKIYFAPGFEFHKKRYKKEELGKVIWYAGAKIDWQNIIGAHIGVDEVDTGQFAKSRQIELATGACMFVKSEVFKKIGFFDEKYFLYLEDMDFCVRAKNQNFRILFNPKAIIWHKNASASGGSGSRLQDYFITRNRLLFAFKYAKLKTKIALLKQIIGQIKNPEKKRALMDFMTCHFGRGSQPIK